MSGNDEQWIFFDLDGTLVDSLPMLREAYRRFMTMHAVVPRLSEFKELNGPSIPEVVSILKRKHGLAGSTQKLTDTYIRCIREVSKKKRDDGDVARLIRGLKKDHRVGLVTSSLRVLARPYVSQASWRGLFDTMTFADEVSAAKPDPELYLRALHKSGATACNALVVEDAPNGVRSAKSAGAYVIGVGRNKVAKALKLAGSDRVIGHLDELKRLLQKDLLVKGRCRTLFCGRRITVVLQKKSQARKDNLFCISQISRKSGSIRISGRFESYRSFVSGIGKKKHGETLTALAVSGLTRIEYKGKNHYLIGQRSSTVGLYRGFWEFVPSGGIDTSCVDRKNNIDFQSKIVDELAEESNIPSGQVASVEPYCLIGEPAMNTCDIGCLISLKPGRPASLKKTDEYNKLFFADETTVNRLLKENKQLVPTMRDLWLNHMNKNQQKGRS